MKEFEENTKNNKNVIHETVKETISKTIQKTVNEIVNNKMKKADNETTKKNESHVRNRTN